MNRPSCKRREINILIKWWVDGKANEVFLGEDVLCCRRTTTSFPRPKCRAIRRWSRAEGIALICTTQTHDTRDMERDEQRRRTWKNIWKMLTKYSSTFNFYEPDSGATVESDVLQLNTWARVQKHGRKCKKYNLFNKITHRSGFGSGRRQAVSFIYLSLDLRHLSKSHSDAAIYVLSLDNESEAMRLSLIVLCNYDF